MGVVQEIPHLGINTQRAVPVLTMKEVKNVTVHILYNTASLSGTNRMSIKSDSIFCKNNRLPQYSSAMAWCCSNFRCSCPIDHTTSLGLLRIADSADCSEHQLTTFLRSTYNCHS